MHAKNYKDITGKRYGRITVLEYDSTDWNGLTKYRVMCDCGKEFTAYRGNLISGKIKSCGCLRVELLKERHKAKNIQKQ